MPLYRYKAVTRAGEMLVGELEGPTRKDIIGRLQDQGHLPVDAEEVSGTSWRSWLNIELTATRRPGLQEIALFTHELATLLSAGLPIDRAFDIVIGMTGSARLRKPLADIRDRIRGGATLADALAAQESIFSRVYCNMVRAGEAGGSLPSVLARLAEYLGRAQALRETVKSALVYPAVLLFTAGVSIVMVLTVVIPQFKPLLEGAGIALPFSTRALFVASEILETYWWLLALAALVGILLLRQGLKTPEFVAAWHRLQLRLPLFGDLRKKAEAGRFARSLGTLVGNGVPVPAALAIVKDTIENQVIQAAVARVVVSLKEGQGLSAPLDRSGVFPAVCIQLMRVGEESGALGDMLLQAADILERDVERSVGRLMTLLVPALTISLGLLIAGIIASVFTALLSINEVAF